MLQTIETTQAVQVGKALALLEFDVMRSVQCLTQAFPKTLEGLMPIYNVSSGLDKRDSEALIGAAMALSGFSLHFDASALRQRSYRRITEAGFGGAWA